MTVNIPEAEGSKTKTLLIFNETVIQLFCDPEEVFECDANDCALELFNLCVKNFVNIPIKNVIVKAIKLLKGGKVIVYSVDDKRYYLCAHRIQGDIIELCKS